MPVIPKTTKNKLNGSDLVDALSRMAQIEATSLLRRITTTEVCSVRELGWRTLTSLAGYLVRVEWKCYGPDTDVWPSAQFCRVPVAWLRLGCWSRWDVNIRAKPPRFFPLLFHSQVASLYDYELQASLPCFVVVSNAGDHLFTTQLYCCAQRGCKLGAGSCRCLTCKWLGEMNVIF